MSPDMIRSYKDSIAEKLPEQDRYTSKRKSMDPSQSVADVEVQRFFQVEHGKVVAEATQALTEINKISEVEGKRRIEESVNNVEKDLSDQTVETQRRLTEF